MNAGHNIDGQPDLGTSATEGPKRLSSNEFGAVYLAARGYDITESAAVLDIHYNTVREHLKGAVSTLGALTVEHAVAISLDQGMMGDVAELPDKGKPETPSLDPGPETVLHRIAEGRRQPEVIYELTAELSEHSVRSYYQTLRLLLNSRTDAHTILRAYQAKLLVPSVVEADMDPEHARWIESTEESFGLPIESVPRFKKMKGKRSAGYDRFESHILLLLNRPNFSIYHPNLGAYLRDRCGYERGDWRNLNSRLEGDYEIIRAKKLYPKPIVYGHELDKEALMANQDRTFVSELVLATYGSLQAVDRQPRLENHFNLLLSQEEEAALEPAERILVALGNPIMANRFESLEELKRIWGALTGQPAQKFDLVIDDFQRKQGLIKIRPRRGTATLEFTSQESKQRVDAAIERLRQEAQARIA